MPGRWSWQTEKPRKTQALPDFQEWEGGAQRGEKFGKRRRNACTSTFVDFIAQETGWPEGDDPASV